MRNNHGGRAMENTDYTISKIKICLKQNLAKAHISKASSTRTQFFSKSQPKKQTEPEVVLKSYSFQGEKKIHKN